jgi:hypothetical protein
MAEGVDGLLRDKTRKPGKLPLPAATVQMRCELVGLKEPTASSPLPAARSRGR